MSQTLLPSITDLGPASGPPFPAVRAQSVIPDIGQPTDDPSLVLVPRQYLEDRAEFGRATAAALIGYIAFADNWDNEGSVAPHPHAIENALGMLEVIPDGIEAPKSMLLADGDVALFWDRGDVYAEIGFDAAGTLYAYAKAPDLEPVHLDDVRVRNEHDVVSFPPKVLEILRWEPLRAMA